MTKMGYDPAGNRSQNVIVGTEPETDGDGIPDGSDNCPSVENGDQENFDGDAQGNACDADDDNDGVPDAQDAFPLNPTEFLDTDRYGIGNNADSDDDNDGIADGSDNCPLVANGNQADADVDGVGNACDPDYFCAECLPRRGGWRSTLPR
jgi:hypothetical protein